MSSDVRHFLAAPEQARARLRRGASTVNPFTSFRPCTEHRREREALRHLHSWIAVYQPTAINRSAFPVISNEGGRSRDSRSPEPCKDPTLAAFAQLCSLRLGVRRVLVTLMSGRVEYVLGEATRSMSLQYDIVEDPKDKLWLGTCSFPRASGINALAVDTWREERRAREPPGDPDFYYKEGISGHSSIVSDMPSNDNYNDIVLVQRAPWLRFYASIPIRSRDGTVIGSLSALDDKPRYGLSLSEMLVMEDSADNIAEHLEACIVRSQRQRSERMIQALSLFNNRQGSLRDWWISQDDVRMTRGGRHAKTNEDRENQQERQNEEFGVQDPEMSDTTVSSRRRLHREASVESEEAYDINRTTRENDAAVENATSQQGIGAQDFDQRPVSEATETARFIGQEREPVQNEHNSAQVDERKPNSGSGKPAQRDGAIDLNAATRDAYARATNLIREAMEAEGVVSVDARTASSSIKSEPSERRLDTAGELSASTEGKGSPSTSDTDYESGNPASKPCKVNGFSTRNRSSLAGTRPDRQRFGLTEIELRRLIKRHPRGKIFNFEEESNIYSSSGDEWVAGWSDRSNAPARERRSKLSREAERLRTTMVGARTIAFYPVWDDTTESWRSCLFVWSTTPMRYFDRVEDLTYLIAFAHSLVADLSRSETLASDIAKGTFISSMSHELRSPLHGVLAGIEMVQDSDLTPAATEMANTVAIAGRTLLDTINNILDFSKISRLTKAQRREQVAAEASRHGAVLKDADNTGSGDANYTVDLARLTEEVVETTVAGHRYLTASNGLLDFSFKSSNDGDQRSLRQSNSLAMTVDIQKRNWNIKIPSGAWTRIVANILGNALKYTDQGIITVELYSSQVSGDENPARQLVSLKVRDTGIGMSQQFLAGDLYTPFKQANSHSSGTGLGLSIVKRLVKDIDGGLEVESELNHGTTVTVTFRAKFDVGAPSLRDLHDWKNERSNATSNPPVISMFLLPEPPGRHVAPISAALRENVAQIAVDWLGCTISSGESRENVESHRACIVLESELNDIVKAQSGFLRALQSTLAAHRTRLIVLGCSIKRPMDESFAGLPVQPLLLSLPVGPRKLLRVLLAAEANVDERFSRPLRDTVAASTSPSSSAKLSKEQKRRAADDNALPHRDSSKIIQGLQQGSRDQSPKNTTSGKEPRSEAGPTRFTAESGLDGAIVSSSIDLRQQDTGHEENNGASAEKDSMVLLVEDNSVNMKILTALMRKLKLPYQCASNGLEAYNIYHANPSEFFLVLMDIDMPVMNGNISTTKIRELERKQKLEKTCVVALTGVTSAESRKESLSVGMDKFYTKPIRMKDLSDLVSEIRAKGTSDNV